MLDGICRGAARIVLGGEGAGPLRVDYKGTLYSGLGRPDIMGLKIDKPTLSSKALII